MVLFAEIVNVVCCVNRLHSRLVCKSCQDMLQPIQQ